MKVAIYIRESGSRQYKPASPRAAYSPDTTFCLRYTHYGKRRWEQLDVKSYKEAQAASLKKLTELITESCKLKPDVGTVISRNLNLPAPRPKPAKPDQPSGELMLDAAIDKYIENIEHRSSKTSSGYRYTLRQFYASSGNSLLANVTTQHLYDFVGYLLGSDVAEPPVRIPSNVAWTARTMAMASSGDALRGLLIGRRCDRCHGREGFSSSPSVPNLAGMDRLVVWKQLDDFRSGKRNSPVMQPIANSLSLEDSADVAAYYWLMPIAPDPQDDRAFPQSLSDPKHEAVAGRLITAGDGNRGLPPCQACHGPVGFVTGAPSLATQNATYLLEQIEGFASGRRANDINLRMRSIVAQLSDEERHALAEFYGAGLAESSARSAGR